MYQVFVRTNFNISSASFFGTATFGVVTSLLFGITTPFLLLKSCPLNVDSIEA